MKTLTRAKGNILEKFKGNYTYWKATFNALVLTETQKPYTNRFLTTDGWKVIFYDPIILYIIICN